MICVANNFFGLIAKTLAGMTFFFFFFLPKTKDVLIKVKKNMIRMRNPTHDTQTWSKDPKKPPLYMKNCTKGTKKAYTSITSPKIHLRTSQCRPNPKVYIPEAN